MSKKLKPRHENIDINKVEESLPAYHLDNNEVQEDEMHPILIKLLEKSIKEHKEGKVFTHEEAMLKMRDKFPFLK